jgi:hypothetical protein
MRQPDRQECAQGARQDLVRNLFDYSITKVETARKRTRSILMSLAYLRIDYQVRKRNE